MKKILIMSIIIAGFWCLPHFISNIFAQDIKHHGKRYHKEKVIKDKRGRNYKIDERGKYRRVYKKDHPVYHKRNRVYRHYKNPRHHRYQGYKYGGHYSWREWKRNRHMYRHHKHQRYHHDDRGYLMFSFCNDEKGTRCFSFSID